MSSNPSYQYLKHELSEVIRHTNGIYGAGAADRLASFFAGMLGETQCAPEHPMQKPRLLFYPGLTNGPWIDGNAHYQTQRVTALLAKSYQAIKAEFTTAAEHLSGYASRELFNNLNENDWSSISLWSRGAFSNKAKYFPHVKEIITECEDSLFPWRGEVTFMRLKAGAYLPEHYDWTNAQITCHFGINIPSKCGLTVAGETRSWQEGEALFFDHSFLHSAFNHSNQDRDILLINMLHPELSTAEVYGIKLLGPILNNVAQKKQPRGLWKNIAIATHGR